MESIKPVPLGKHLWIKRWLTTLLIAIRLGESIHRYSQRWTAFAKPSNYVIAIICGVGEKSNNKEKKISKLNATWFDRHELALRKDLPEE